MTERRSRELPFLFTIAALDVLAVGYHFFHQRPVTIVVSCSLVLVGLLQFVAMIPCGRWPGPCASQRLRIERDDVSPQLRG